MKEVKARFFTFYYEEETKNIKCVKVVAKDFGTAIISKFGKDEKQWPNFTNIYSDEVVTYVAE